jgi:hypothetical protein
MIGPARRVVNITVRPGCYWTTVIRRRWWPRPIVVVLN